MKGLEWLYLSQMKCSFVEELDEDEFNLLVSHEGGKSMSTYATQVFVYLVIPAVQTSNRF